jgi:hypothetical protein
MGATQPARGVRFRFDEARRALDLARMIDPKSPAIGEAERHSRQSQARAKTPACARIVTGRIAEVRRLLAGAADSKRAATCSRPPGDSAYDQIRRARALAPDDPSVRCGTSAAAARCAHVFRRCIARQSPRCVRKAAWMRATSSATAARASCEARNRLAMRWIAVGQERLGAGKSRRRSVR